MVGYRWLLRVIQYTELMLLAAAFALPYSMFISTLWVIAGFGIVVLLFFLTRLVWMARSRTVLWYVASLAVVLFSPRSRKCSARRSG